ADQIFTNRRAQNGATIGKAGKRCLTGALELNLPSLTATVTDIAQRYRPTIPKLPGPDAKLMPGITMCHRPRALWQPIAGKRLGECRRLSSARVQIQQRSNIRVEGYRIWLGDRRCLLWYDIRRSQPSQPVPPCQCK